METGVFRRKRQLNTSATAIGAGNMLTDQQRERITALLVRRNFIDQSMRSGLFFEKGTDCFVDLNRTPIAYEVLAGAKEIVGNHGIVKLYSLEQEINGILASKALQQPQPPAPSLPKDVTQVDNRAEIRPPAGADCKPAPAKPVKRGPYFGESFGALYDKGVPKEEIMRLKGMKDEQDYFRAEASLHKIRGL